MLHILRISDCIVCSSIASIQVDPVQSLSGSLL